MTDAATAWKYKKVTGRVRQRLAALRQYGLLQGKKGTAPRLSMRAQVLAVRTADTPEFREAVRDSALAPSLFRELHAKGEATDEVLRGFLILEKRFSEVGATSVINVYRASLALAELDEDAMIPESDEGSEEPDEIEGEDMATPTTVHSATPHAPPMSPDHIRIPLQLMNNTRVAFELPSSMSVEAWEQMTSVLDLLKASHTEYSGNLPTEEGGA